MLSLFSPARKTHDRHWRLAHNDLIRQYRALIAALPPELQGDAFDEAREALAWLQEHETGPAEEDSDLALLILDPDHALILLQWLLSAQGKHELELHRDQHRSLAKTFRRLVAALPADLDSPAIAAARAYANSLCLACGHHRPLTPKLWMCRNCAWSYPIGNEDARPYIAEGERRSWSLTLPSANS